MIEQVGRVVPDVVLQRYLLGDLNRALRGILERLYFLSDNLHNRLEIVEAELVDDYVYGRLPADRRLRFENAYLTSEARRDNVSIAVALRDYPVDVTPPSRVPLAPAKRTRMTRWSVVLAALCLMAAGIWVLQVRRQAIFTVILTPELSGYRSPTDAETPFSVPRGIRKVLFEIHPREPHRQRYSAVLKIDRTVVETVAEIATSNAGVLTIEVPAAKLKTGTCSLELTATDVAPRVRPDEDFRFELLIRP